MTKEQQEQMEQTPFSISFTCVDGLIVHKNKIAMIKKSNKDNLLRLPGGMVDTTDLTFMDAFKREMEEEINLTSRDINEITLLGSFLMYDKGRYSDEVSKHRLRTIVFSADVSKNTVDSSLFTEPPLKAGDDATSVEWVELKKFRDIAWANEHVMSGHIPLIYLLLGGNLIEQI
jgi:ADP-ribose pyrophosphatase YjhB (NUDIX family)